MPRRLFHHVRHRRGVGVEPSAHILALEDERVDAGEPVELGGLKVVSPAGGWQGTIRTSEDGVTWSPPGPPEEAGTEHVFQTSGAHRFWMLWITTLTTTPGTGDSANPWGVAIREIQVQPTSN